MSDTESVLTQKDDMVGRFRARLPEDLQFDFDRVANYLFRKAEDAGADWMRRRIIAFLGYEEDDHE